MTSWNPDPAAAGEVKAVSILFQILFVSIIFWRKSMAECRMGVKGIIKAVGQSRLGFAKNKLAILGVEAAVSQGAKTQEYPDIPR